VQALFGGEGLVQYCSNKKNSSIREDKREGKKTKRLSIWHIEAMKNLNKKGQAS